MDVSTNTVLMINIGVILFLVLLTWSGYKQGFLMKLLSILGFFVVGILAWWLSSPLAKFIGLYPIDQLSLQDNVITDIVYNKLNRFVVFIVLFVVLNVVILCLKPIVKALSSIPVVSTINKVFGSILGLIQAVLLLFVVTMVMRLPFFANGTALVEQSFLKYSEQGSNSILEYAKGPMKDIHLLYQAMDHKQALTKQEIADIQTWLLSCGVQEDNVKAFIATLKNTEDER